MQFIDRETGLAAAFGTCILPPGDAPTDELMKVYELGLYEQLKGDP